MDDSYMADLLSERREERRNADAKSKLEEAKNIAKYADMAIEWMSDLGITITDEQALILGKKIFHAGMMTTIELLLSGMDKKRERDPLR